MHDSVMRWGEHVLTADMCAGKRIMEVGSYNVNGSLREYATRHQPRMYVGVDMQWGPGVDIVCDAADVDTIFNHDMDVIICTEMLEHAADPYWVLDAFAYTLHHDGVLILSTRSPGFPYHGFPDDFWRYTVDSITQLLTLFGFKADVQPDPDPQSPGVLAVAHRRSMPRHDIRKTVEALLIPVEQPR